jgi:hypothetical protein
MSGPQDEAEWFKAALERSATEIRKLRERGEHEAADAFEADFRGDLESHGMSWDSWQAMTDDERAHWALNVRQARRN